LTVEGSADEKAELAKENLALKRELVRQWEINHGEHCGVLLTECWPLHAGECHWKLPDSISPSEAYLLLLLASGKSFGLRL
jgi:hypothetical protein